jgi:hypothetical protein
MASTAMETESAANPASHLGIARIMKTAKITGDDTQPEMKGLSGRPAMGTATKPKLDVMMR